MRDRCHSMRNREARRFGLIVFDWDGTLADSTSIIAASIQAACCDIGQPVPDDAAARYVIGLGFTAAARHVAPALAPERYAMLSAAYRDHYMAREAAIPLFAGARELLDELAEAGYLLAVATGKSRAGLDHALTRNGLQGMFHATRCADEGMPKPHPEMLLSLMSLLGTTSERTLMIGDTTHDLDLARNAGTCALAVAYGAHERMSLAQRNPVATVDSIGTLRQWLSANA